MIASGMKLQVMNHYNYNVGCHSGELLQVHHSFPVLKLAGSTEVSRTRKLSNGMC